jgi:putative transposase
MGRLKSDPIPDGHVACGARGTAINVGVGVDIAYRVEGAKQRAVWNHFLAIQIDTYAALGEFVFYHEMARRLTLLRKADPWIGIGGIAAQQQTLRSLDKALKDSFPSAKSRKGFPRFRKASARNDRTTVPAVSVRTVRLEDGTVTHIGLPNMPLLRTRNLKLPSGARLTNATVAMDGDGWSVSLGMIAPTPKAPVPSLSSLGVEMGLTTLATAASTDHGFVIEIDNPKPLAKAMKRLRFSSRKLARRTKGSVGRRRAAREVGRRHRKVADQRRGHQHRATRTIVNMAGHISVETLSLKGLMRTHSSRAIADAGMGGFLQKLKYKSQWAARGFTALNRFDRSTGCCPDCVFVGPRLERHIRNWTCPNCGIKHERDIAAARWIDMVGRQSPEPGQASPDPKRGSAENRKERLRRSAWLGPPSNVPHGKAPQIEAPVG